VCTSEPPIPITSYAVPALSKLDPCPPGSSLYLSYGAKGRDRVGLRQGWTGQRGSNVSNRGRQ
jgi:hypothetical protein